MRARDDPARAIVRCSGGAGHRSAGAPHVEQQHLDGSSRPQVLTPYQPLSGASLRSFRRGAGRAGVAL